MRLGASLMHSTHARRVATVGQLEVPICFYNDAQPRKRYISLDAVVRARLESSNAS